MISQSAVNAGKQIADYLAFSGKTLSPTQGEIKVLVDSVWDPNLTLDVNTLKDQSVQVVKPTIGPHANADERLSDILSKAMANIHNVAKNTVLAHVKAIKERVNQKITNELDSLCVKDTNVQLLETPSLFTDELFLSLVSGYKTPTASSLDISLKEAATISKLKGVFTSDDFKTLLVTDNQLLDGRLLSLYGDYNADFWYEYGFDIRSEDLKNRALDALYFQIALFIIVNNIVNGKLPKANFLLDDNNDSVNLSSFRNILATSISAKVSLFMTLVNNNTLIAPSYYRDLYKKIPSDVPTLLLFGKQYRKWLSEGGSTEAMLGYHQSQGSNNANLYDLNSPDGIARYTKIYNSNLKTAKNAVELNKLSIIKKEIRLYMSSVIANDTETDKIDSRQGILADIINKDLYYSSDIESYLITVVCKCLVERDDVLNFILDTQRILATNTEEYEDNVAALNYALELATVRMLVKWASERMVIGKDSGL